MILLDGLVDLFKNREQFDPGIIHAYRDIDHIANKLGTGPMLRDSQGPVGNTLDLA